MITALIFAGCGVVLGGSHTREFRIMLLAVMTLTGIAACLMIHWRQKKIMKMRLARHLLETEFREQLWENAGGTGVMEAGTIESIREKGGAGAMEGIQEKGRAGIISMMQEKNKEQMQIPAEESVK